MGLNIVWHQSAIGRKDRESLNNHKAACLWFTGLSGSGKSTLASEVEYQLYNRGIHTYILDGDNIRHGLNKDLGFSSEDRKENIRRTGEVAKLFVDANIIVIAALISPFIAERQLVRNIFPEKDFIEIYIRCSLEICEKRDPKGLYRKARQNLIPEFTGINSPYEIPLNPELIIDNEDSTPVEVNASRIIKYLEENHFLEK